MFVDEIHIHEDDWAMRNLYPIAAESEAERDLGAAAKSARENAATDGVGWTSMHLIEPPKADFTTVGLTLDAARRALAPLLPRVGRFIATATAGFDRTTADPWGSYDDAPVAFGFDAQCFVKLEPLGELVKGAWFEASTANAAHLDALRRAIEQFDVCAESILADYWANAAGRVRDREFMDRYFSSLKNAADD